MPLRQSRHVGCTRQSIARRLRGWFFPSLQLRDIWSAESSTGLPSTRQTELLERLERLPCEERLRKLRLFTVERRRSLGKDAYA